MTSSRGQSVADESRSRDPFLTPVQKPPEVCVLPPKRGGRRNGRPTSRRRPRSPNTAPRTADARSYTRCVPSRRPHPAHVLLVGGLTEVKRFGRIGFERFRH